MVDKLLLKPEEAADLLSVGRSKFYELLLAGVIESVRIGSCRRVPLVALQDFVARLREGGSGPARAKSLVDRLE